MGSRVKTEEEIALIAEASRIVGGALIMLKEFTVEGVTTSKLDRIAEEYIRSYDAEPAFKGYSAHGEVYPATLCTSINEAVVHGLPSDYVLKSGDVVSLDCGAKKGGYYGDSAITYMIGEVSEENQRLVKVTEEALWLGIEQAVPGNRVFDISRAVQRHVEANGFSVVRELVGHGIGTSLHEEPSIPNFIPSPFMRHQFKNVALVEGMVFCIEPMVNAGTYRVNTLADRWTVVTQDGKPSAHFEHTLVVREEAPEILTRPVVES